MKPLIVYYSHSGNNEVLALKLRDQIGCEAFKIREKKKRTIRSIIFDLIFHRKPKLESTPEVASQEYLFVFVAPIWAGKIAFPLRSFMEKEKGSIQKYIFMTVSGGSGEKKRITERLCSILGREPMEVKEFGVDSLAPKDIKMKDFFRYHVSSADLDRFSADLEEIAGMVKSACQ